MPFTAPSAAPSMEELIFSDQAFYTQLYVFEERKMIAVEQEMFRRYGTIDDRGVLSVYYPTCVY